MTMYDKRSPADAYSDPENDHYPYLQLKTSSHLIIPQWSTGSIYGLVAAMLAAIFAGVGYEFINEYSRHLHNRYTRKDGSRCCGVDVFGCCEKFFMSILVVIRVIVGYFMMLCIMTMNIWLLVSVILGAGIGYAIGKPVIANIFTDSISSYEYPVVRVKPSDDDDEEFGGNITARSQSWRYRPTSKRLMESTGKRLMESTAAHDDVSQRQKDNFTRYTLRPNSSNQDAINVILVRESKHGARVPHVTDIKDEDDIVFLRAKADDTPETRTAYSQTLPASHNRFKSTSLVINQSFRSTSSYSPRQSRVKSGTSSSSRSPKGSGRFKPISKVLIDQQTSDHV